jgi:DNA repair protein RadC
MIADPEQPVEDPLNLLRRVGADATSDLDLLSLCLAPGGDPTDSRLRAAKLLSHHGGLRGLVRAGPGALAEALGERRGLRLHAALELSRRALCEPMNRRAPYGNSRDVARAWRPRLADLPEECVVVVALDRRGRPMAERILAHGTPSACSVSARVVFTFGLREGATSLVLVHNHPSGDPVPSGDDVRFTERLATLGDTLELRIMDHVIVAREGTFSFLDAGLLAEVHPRPR